MQARHHMGDRHLGLDWLRIGAFGLLILYHIGMVFAPGSWVVKAPRLVEAADWPMLAIQPFRMSLIFAISGYATFALMRSTEGTGRFLVLRSWRLLLPLAFGICLLIPPQSWIELRFAGHYHHGFLQFLSEEWLAFRPIDGVRLPQLQHLWFLPYLWTYTVALALFVVLLPPNALMRFRAAVEWLGQGQRLLWAPLALLLPARVFLLFTVPEQHGLLHDWVSDLLYGPFFLLGFLLAAKPALWLSVVKCRRWLPPVALLGYLLLVAIDLRYPSGEMTRPHLVQALDRMAAAAMAWSMVLLLLGIAHRHWNRDHPLRRSLSRAIFPSYLIHQTIIVVTAWLLLGSRLSNVAMFLILVLATITGCWLFYEIGRRIEILRPFIGLRPARPTALRPARSDELIPAE